MFTCVPDDTNKVENAQSNKTICLFVIRSLKRIMNISIRCHRNS